MALKAWDQYVTDTTREPVELPFKRSKLSITFPTDDQVRAFNAARFTGNTEAALLALLGDTNGAKVYEAGKTAPYGALDALMNDVLIEFGLRPGNSETSSS